MDTDGSRRIGDIVLVLSEAQPNGARNRSLSLAETVEILNPLKDTARPPQ